MWVRDMKELKNRSVQKTTIGLSIAAFAAMCIVVLIIPVSYTHLDVYKRQVIHRQNPLR